MVLTNDEYVKVYKDYHDNRKDEHGFTKDDKLSVRGLVVGSRSKTVLDCGSGKGLQYTVDKVNRYFHIDDDNVSCYDIAIPEYSTLPDGPFDGVICMDVLEHIPEEFLDDNIKAIFERATKFVYIIVHCGLAKKILSNGENAHCTIKPPSWWKQKITQYNTKDVPLILTYKIPTNPKLNPLNLK